MKCFIHRSVVTVAGAVLAAGLASNAAAVINTTLTGPGNANELTLWVFDQQSNKSYTRDLGISLDNFRVNSTQIPLAGIYAFNASLDAAIPLGAASGLGLNALGYTLTFGADPLFTSFFSAEEIARASYQVIAAKGTVTQYAALSTSNSGLPAVQATQHAQLNNFKTIDNVIEGVNVAGTHVGHLNGSSATDNPDDIGNVGKSLGSNFNSNAGFTTDALVGTALSFYQLTRSSASAFAPVAVTEFAGAWLLSTDGSLTYAVPVPEPETWALMIAGLALVGTAVRRRRSL